ncbi:MAG: hypothetical protein AB7U83_08430 [Vicinamibacterales bacterium]
MTVRVGRLGVVLGLGLAATTGAWAQESAADRADLAVPMATARRTSAAVPVAPPPLPEGADRIPPLTLRTVVRKPAGGRVHEVRQTITRSAERMHVATTSGAEWLFERNPRDPRRVDGRYVDHGARTIVYYSDSDLRNVLGVDGWARLLTLGFDQRSLGDMTPTGTARTMAGLRFVRHAGRDGVVWWNPEALLPIEMSNHVSGGEARLVVETVSATIDAARLRAPSQRFPGYRQVELAEWLEAH